MDRTAATLLPGIAKLPQPLRAAIGSQWETFIAEASAAELSLLLDSEVATSVAQVWSGSEFVSRNCTREPALLAQLIGSGDLQRSYTEQELAGLVAERLDWVSSEADLQRSLRTFRRREMVRIAWRDLAGWAELDETLRELSWLADAAICGALAKLDQWQSEEWGQPLDAEGERQQLVVLGMGKLGAYELNFSSDIDLIFFFAESGETSGAKSSVTNARYFQRLGQRLIQALDSVTADGFVFRVDMRLRPYGDSGPLVMSFDALEQYYQSQGREWERYAMIKARAVTGREQDVALLMELLRPFIYRRYLDFGAFESIREMKALISRELLRRGLTENIKLGPGGIREVEFIGQAFQLIRGGREPALQERGICAVLDLLVAKQHLPQSAGAELKSAYSFLRRVENRLQEFSDQQTHQLPSDALGRSRLAYLMGFVSWQEFEQQLTQCRTQVHDHFRQVFATPEGEEEPKGGSDIALVWDAVLDRSQALALLEEAGFNPADEALTVLEQFKQSPTCRAMSAKGRGRLDRLIPPLLTAVAATDEPVIALQRIFLLVESIARRSAYVALLIENPTALTQMVKLSSASPWIARLLARYPILLDGLMDPRTLYAPLNIEELQQDLAQRLQNAGDDQEAQMEALRHFKHTNVLRVAAADVADVMPLMVVSDHLTAIAEVVLQQTLRICQEHLNSRYGQPQCCDDNQIRAAGFIIIAYGKLGGYELGYGSDLDIVFLHNSRGEKQHTDGDKPLDNATYFARLAQRLIHILNTPMPAGTLYDIDTRLRPSGASGMMVSSFDAFREYQLNQAWTWEQQALVRARFVAGSPELAESFQKLRSDVLCRSRQPDELLEDVVTMRERMREQLDSSSGSSYSVKQGQGGIADIEFMVQYSVLRWAEKHPELTTYTDNIRNLEGLTAAGIIATADAELLKDAYRAYRKLAHRSALQESEALVSDNRFDEIRAQVAKIWSRVMQP